ncbi:putative ATP-dependent endonuclease of the OLD family [Petrocella atlantisensis]|uniref:Putative ATP-dependent endonuclease of the OLD family n=1 Tax=Petrocella atlantisensis TaxID=2173034 RepID=A0A3P7Q0I3_9FIRM|nr:AAA family ATPase [Petrocella atlantisensis]VDN49247.1 putative ATP-dependent endonuclease of the OLD family [Petrocella atlantisensis]
MYLSHLKLWNFRRYGSKGEIDLSEPDLSVDFKEGLNLLTGENDSGKTAIVDAIKTVLKTSSNDWIRLNEDDFYDDTNELRIELCIKGFVASEAKHFTEYLTTVFSEEDAVNELHLSFTASKSEGKIKSSDVRAGVGDGRILPADAREYLKATYLRPLRDARAELIPKRNSRLSQIFAEHRAFKDRDDHILLNIYKEFNEAIESYFDGKDSQGNPLTDDQYGKELKKSIDNTIGNFFETTKSTQLSTSSAQMRRILESLELSFSNSINPGLGSLNRLFMASELVHLSKEDWTGLRLGLIEEIEAHLHPQVQLKVIRSLLKLEKTQLILTTHSPNLASKVPLENQIICRNNSAFPMGHKYTNLTKAQYVFLDKFLDVTRSSMFFAKGLVLVEGWSEELLIPIIADRIGFNLVDNEVTVINVSNLGFENYFSVFSRKDGRSMGTNISVITDCDVRAYSEEIVNSNKEYTKVDDEQYKKECASAVIAIKEKYTDDVKAYVAEEWTLEWCLMKSEVLGELFVNTVKKVHLNGNWDDDKELQLAEKLYKKSLNKSEIAYQMVKTLTEDKKEMDISALRTDESMKHIYEAIKNACS